MPVAKKAFMKLYRRYRGRRLMIKPDTSIDKMIDYKYREVHNRDSEDMLRTYFIVNGIINMAVRKLLEKEQAKKWVKSIEDILTYESWGRAVLDIIGAAVYKRVNMAVFLDRPETNMMPLEQVAFITSLIMLNTTIPNNTVAVVILTTTQYIARPRYTNVYFVYKEDYRLRYEAKPLKAFAVADLMI